MKLGFIGLGRMGMNMVRRLIQGGHDVIAYNRTQEKVQQIANEGAKASSSVEDLVSQLSGQKIIWLMLPSGKIVDDHIDQLIPLLQKGDIIIEGGNTNFSDDIRRAEKLMKHGIEYIDAGISGGIWGLKIGYCSMYGGKKEIFDIIEPIAKTLAPDNGYLYCGETGAGHYVKMVHNGIEYALMEAYGEGFELLKASPYGKGLQLENVSQLWNQGSVIRSWLLELIQNSFKNDPHLDEIQGYVEDSGEARWTVFEAINNGVAAPVIAHSLFKRFQSRQEDTFSDKVVAALRKEFGGHATYSKTQDVKTKEAGAGTVQHASKDESYKL